MAKPIKQKSDGLDTDGRAPLHPRAQHCLSRPPRRALLCGYSVERTPLKASCLGAATAPSFTLSGDEQGRFR